MYYTDKLKRILNIDDEIELKELFDIIYNYRNSQHPDKFADEDMKTIVTDKFVEAGNALDEIKNEINRQVKSEIVNSQNPLEVYGKYIGDRTDKFEILELQKKINDLNDQVNKYKNIVKNVHRTEKKEIKDKLNKENEIIISRVAIDKKDKSIFGGVITITGLLFIIQQVGTFKSFLVEESFINSLVFKFGVTIFILLFLIYFSLKFYAEKNYTKILNNTQTAEFRVRLLNYCKEEKVSMSDSTIAKFIKIQIGEEKLMLFLCEKLFFIKVGYLSEILKDNFIYWALQKKYLKYSSTSNGEHIYEFISYGNTWRKDNDKDWEAFFEEIDLA